MSSFDDREKAFENKYRHDQDLQFRIRNRRNKLLGLWCAEAMGLGADEAEAYAREIVAVDLEKAGDGDMLARIRADLDARNIELSDHRLHKKLEELQTAAREQVMSEVREA